MNNTNFAEVQITKKSWPSPQDYNEALQHPKTGFSEHELRRGKAELNNLGLPRSITGSFASVYRMHCAHQDYAVRCFLKNVADQKDRYAKISTYLNQIALPIMVDFDYLDTGIRTNNNWYPVLRMDWVDGQTLTEYIGRNLDNPKALEKLRQWLGNARRTLAENGIAHGDLQHGNILVTKKDIRLVDYDGMFVPELKGYESNELGHRNYQHPGRSKSDFGPHLDNFSAWLIDTSLYCLERDPRLWFDLNGGEDCLLFRESDLKDPLSSYAFHKLETHDDEEIRTRAKLLRWLLTLPVEQVPDIDVEVEVPDTFPALNPAGLKPDWLSSSEYLKKPMVALTKAQESAQNHAASTNALANQSEIPWILFRTACFLCIVLFLVLLIILLMSSTYFQHEPTVATNPVNATQPLVRLVQSKPSPQKMDYTVRLQLRGGAGGGNPRQIDMTGTPNMYLRDVSPRPVVNGEDVNIHEPAVGYFEGGLIPKGKVWLVEKVTCYGSANGDSNGHGEVILSMGGQEIVHHRDTIVPFAITRHVHILIHPGQESTVFVEIANSSQVDVSIQGQLLDANDIRAQF